MCGIAGVVRRDGSPAGDPAQLASALSGALTHRGPDGCGSWTSPDRDVLFVHRRLAIIDPTPDGAQPMTTPDGRYRIVFNGEVYNYRDLRAELAGRGERFSTASDTEVLLRLIAVEGPQSLARVRGMFAFACWDDVSRSLLLARDRFGIKPLYIAAKSDTLAFASELGALRAAGLLDATPSPTGVAAFMSWGSVPPPLTWAAGAEMLPAGSWREWRRDGPGVIERRGVFADIRDEYASTGDGPVDTDQWRERVGSAFRDSVRAHLVADVPVGVFLSGGIDSGAIVSAATSCTSGVQTFTVGFDDASSETGRAREVADRFGTRHHELHLDASRIVADLPAILDRLDQPTNDAINSYYVSRAVAATGIKAVLSGTGGDELFGGYPTFSNVPKAMAAKRAAGPLWPVVAAAGRAVMPARLRARWTHFAQTGGDMSHLIGAYRAQRGFLLPAELAELAGPRLREPDVWEPASRQLGAVERSLLDATGPERPLAAVARLESRLYMQAQLLRDIDVMSMAHGLEVRVPFVDHVLLAAVWPELGRHRSLLAGKRLLYATLERQLPDAVVHHPKQGFTLPFGRWMRGELAPFVRAGLDSLARGGWIVADGPVRVWRDWQAGVTHWSRPWGLAVLGHFLGAS